MLKKIISKLFCNLPSENEKVKYCKECNKPILQEEILKKYPNTQKMAIWTIIKFCSKKCNIIYNKRKRKRILNTLEGKIESKNSRDMWYKYYGGREKVAEILAKRNRELSFIPLLNNIFTDTNIPIAYHHINNIFVIPIPEITHKKYNSPNRDIHRLKLKPIIENIYQIDLDVFLKS